MSTLRKKQDQLYQWLLEYFKQQGRSPTVREMMAAFGYTSPDTIRRLLARLKTAGLITFSGEREARSIQLVGYRLMLTKEEEAA